ncbi:MAG TPA: hypothetical protein VNI58_08165 [Mariprofundaceae bacterium]|nr:hypothetical protein [Mariprofundaceae bacterium]
MAGRLLRALLLLAWAIPALPCQAAADPAVDEPHQEYLYYRDVMVPQFQKLREFFDMPDRPGHYEVTMVSDAIGPLTFRLVRVHGDHEVTVAQKRSYHVGDHQFQYGFDNPHGADDLLVEIANSNPAVAAKVSVYVVELP